MVYTLKTALVTGSAGFIGFHLSKMMLNEGWRVIGLDNFSDYYDVSLKKNREKILKKFPQYQPVEASINDKEVLFSVFKREQPEIVIHLAGQAGVRASIENPQSYLDTNISGTFQLLEIAKNFSPNHFLIASTSSIYGANTRKPFSEKDKADHQMSFYAATKKSIESISHSYSHLFNLPITIFRFFTVYGPWGRPDMAYFKFTKNILSGIPIDVYNNGKMERDFTFIDDLVKSIFLLLNCIPGEEHKKKIISNDNQSTVAPFRIVNIGNSNPVKLKDFISAIEGALGIEAKRNLLPMQPGDVSSTWASSKLLQELTGYCPDTDLKVGINSFVEWYRKYYKV